MAERREERVEEEDADEEHASEARTGSTQARAPNARAGSGGLCSPVRLHSLLLGDVHDARMRSRREESGRP
jgi:hypothetical protein